MARRFKTRGIKANKAYSVDELADVTGASVSAVRIWLREGLQRIDGSRPILILGFQALDFLNARRAKSKRPLKPGEFLCFRCSAARTALWAMADYEPITATSGRLKALCSVCEGTINLNVSARNLPEIRKVLDVEIKGSR